MNVLKLTARWLAPLRWLCLATLFAIASSSVFAQLPVILQQPQGQTNPVGMPVNFSVVVSSLSTPTYQWRFNNQPIPGAISTNYGIPVSQVTNSGVYSVTVTNATGGVISSNATLLVLGPPAIIGQPTNSSKAQGTTAIFAVNVVGPGPLTYQWRYNTNTLLPGATNSISQGNVQIWQAGSYQAIVANSYGSVTSSPAQLTVTLGTGWPGCWGNTAQPASTVPIVHETGHKAVAAGGAYTLAIKTNDIVTAWGDNTYGQLNLSGFSNITAIAAGQNHSLALSNGIVVGAGLNSSGQIDAPPLTGVTAIAAGAQHSLALLSDGTVAAWGDNSLDQTNVPPDLTNVVRIAAGYYHNLALKRDGTVVCWGNTNNGECDPPGGLEGVIAIAAGNGFSYALRTNGLIALWGDNSSGQLAIPPTLLTGGGVAAIAAGEANALALKENGQIYAWGRTTYGATNIPTAATNMAAIAVGGNHCVALKSPGVPAMACQPWSQTIDASSNTVFTGIAVGFGSLRYQWRFNGTNIAGATNKWFGITNAQSSDAGSYILIVSNALGSSASVTSSIATLTVTSTAVPAAPIWSNAFFDNAGFHARLTGTPGNYVIESALTPVFVAPASITTNIPGVGYIDLLDGTATRAGNRYYRAYSQ